ncbi:MAG: YlmH/Sll1252 family protein, partial [Clostridia bacterium]
KYVSCVKIVPNVKEKLQHKDYMGSIFSLGIKNEMIGDIVAFDDCAYVFCMNNVSNYLVNNFVQVGKNSVKIEILDIYSPIVLELKTTLVVAMYIVSSLRVDIVLSTVFNICRSKIKEKILKGDMCINSKEILNCSEIIKYNDILALKHFGKIKIGNILKKAKNNILEIYKYS